MTELPREIWEDVVYDIERAEFHFSMAVEAFEKLETMPKTREIYYVEMTFQHAMQCAYTSLEMAIKRIFNIAGELLPTGGSTHDQLLKMACRSWGVRPMIFQNAETHLDLKILKGFRHVAAHSYDDFVPELAKPSALAAKRVKGKLKQQILEFIEKFDPCLDAPDDAQQQTKKMHPRG